MTVPEFSSQFDTLVDSYRRFKRFDMMDMTDSVEFNEYEKSVYLTKSQEELVISLYTGKNPYGESFENTEELRRYLSKLTAEDTLSPSEETGLTGMGSKSKFFILPENLWFITYESVSVTGGRCDGYTTLDVVPTTQDEYQKVRKNPFRGVNDRRALRLDLGEKTVEVVSKYDVESYYIRYLRMPSPIVLTNLPNGLTVGGKSTVTPCELHEALHQRILERAVLLALQSKGFRIGNNENDSRPQSLQRPSDNV